MIEFVQTLLIACIPAIITGLVTYIIACRNAASQIDIVKEQNKHDLEKLMEQHKVDIDHLKEAHKLEMESKEQDHKNRLELLQKDSENAMASEAIKGMFGMIGNVIDTPEGKRMLNDSIKKSREKSQEG